MRGGAFIRTRHRYFKDELVGVFKTEMYNLRHLDVSVATTEMATLENRRFRGGGLEIGK